MQDETFYSFDTTATCEDVRKYGRTHAETSPIPHYRNLVRMTEPAYLSKLIPAIPVLAILHGCNKEYDYIHSTLCFRKSASFSLFLYPSVKNNPI